MTARYQVFPSGWMKDFPDCQRARKKPTLGIIVKESRFQCRPGAGTGVPRGGAVWLGCS